MNDIHDDFKAAAEEYANRLAAKREAANNPAKTKQDNGKAFEEHINALLEQQQNDGTRIIINTL